MTALLTTIAAAWQEPECMSPGVELTGWTMHLTQPWEEGVLIVASYGRQPGSPEHLSVRCSFVRHTGYGWQAQRHRWGLTTHDGSDVRQHGCRG